jgi:hypothetical protein
MARARNIKPALFKNELLGVADPLLTLLFESLWCLADREGRLEDRPLRIKAETFPYREGINIGSMLDELQSMGFIVRYVVAGMALIQIVNFKKHQTPHNTEKPSELPEMLTEVLSLDNGEIPQAKRSDSLNPPTDTGFPPTEAPSAQDEYPDDFERVWKEYPQRPGASKKGALKAWKARLKAGVDVDTLLAGVVRYAAYVEAERTEPRFIKQPETFFGPDEHYLSDWTPRQPRASPAAPSQLGKAGQATAANAQRLLEKMRREHGSTG